jgi:hypothetical protein
MVINYVYRLATSSFNQCCFHETQKTSVCYVVTCAAIAGCRTPTVDGLWRVAVCVFFHTPPFGEEQRRTVCEILPLIGTMKSYPNYPPSLAVIGHFTSNLCL